MGFRLYISIGGFLIPEPEVRNLGSKQVINMDIFVGSVLKVQGFFSGILRTSVLQMLKIRIIWAVTFFLLEDKYWLPIIIA